ncbi:site-specific DNA-methyltransferase (adenine-specific) [Virgibacillus subterraneus]|uniref:Site-specific DNA-methyltransferase (Adenine-specific) n=1 Tax=Virgibacillus subterraneus TaxID=621109 RepID=A0A1H9DAB5_9BACI|nr:class I SAM-dependent methyltransferase [Virgibacillus subterraneus]SEQ10436.1 site-specific DNA-methyltransferase (adenine-specific) [Virgibacillus subterraneus]
MEKMNVEVLFEKIDNATETVQQHVNETYLDSLAMTLEVFFHEYVSEETDDVLKHKLQTIIKDIDIPEYQTEEVRKAVQLAILKGMKGTTQQQHLMTPETVALFVGYLAEKVTNGKEKLRVFDPASGTGNLLTTVLGHLENTEETFASEVDPTLIKLAVLNANLQKKEVEFFHQDSLTPFLMDPVDLIVADLPVGYYPDDVRANDFELKADEGHSYSHHLFIEQSMNYTKEGGYSIFVIPDFLFDSDQSDKLHAYIQEYAHIIGVLRLPESMFKSEKNIKSILILQKKGKGTTAPKQPLLVKLPSFKDTTAMNDILGQMNTWFSANIKN